jgi:uncharacterized membrane protein (UPF0127 family)
MKIIFGKKRIEIPVRKVSLLGGVRGLMFRGKETKNLMFEYTGRIHSFFVFFKFLILWLDEKNNVVDWRVVRPFSLRVKSKKKFEKFVEIPLNKDNFEKFNFLFKAL